MQEVLPAAAAAAQAVEPVAVAEYDDNYVPKHRFVYFIIMEYCVTSVTS